MKIDVSWLATSLLLAGIPFSIWLITYFARRGELEIAFYVIFGGYVTFVLALYRVIHSAGWYFRVVVVAYPLVAFI